MDVLKPLRKCLICRKRDNSLRYVKRFGIYGEVDWLSYAYHPVCVHTVCENPESHSHREVDAALEIAELIKEHENRHLEKAKRFKIQCEKLEEICPEV